jgi:alanine transaminase
LDATGALYAFVSIELPLEAIKVAEAAGKQPDVFFALELLEATGVCVVPGSGFGMPNGAWFFRTTILPPEDQLSDVLERLTTFYSAFRAKYSVLVE